MKVIVAENHEEVSRLAADILEETVRANPCCTLGLATGSSPVGMYRELSRRCREEGLDFSRVHSVNLDEYVGLAPTHEQSYRYFMDSNLFDHINIDKANTYVAKGTGDAEENLREFNAVLDRTDIDVQVLGVGPDDTPELCEKLADTRRCSTRAPSTPTSASSPRATMCRATRSPWAWATSCARKSSL